MNAAKRLYAEYEEKWKQLRETCPHAEWTDWMDGLYGPCHSTGNEVRLCANCELVLDRRKAVVGHSNYVF
jgi:hypothetical protein